MTEQEKIAAQAVVIEKLRDALGYYANSNHDEFQNTARKALAIPTDSTQVLQEWLDEKLGEPVAVCDTKNRIRFGGNDDSHRYASAPSWLEVGAQLFKKPEIK